MVTIIIPHYNTPFLLKRLLSTIPVRDDLEVIVVDDCSPQVSLIEISKVVDSTCNVVLLSTGVNGGGGKARNIGLQHAKGKYVLFADADDYFTPALDEILDSIMADKEENDIVFFNAMSADSETYHISNRVNHLNRYIDQANHNDPNGLLNLRYIFGEPWCKIIRREIIEKNNIRFEEIPIHNDTLFSYLCGFYATKARIDDRVGYCVTDRPHSVSKELSDEKYIKRAEVFAKKNRFLITNQIPIFDDLMMSSLLLAKRRGKKDLQGKLLETYSKYGFPKSQISQYLYRYIAKIGWSKIRTILKF